MSSGAKHETFKPVANAGPDVQRDDFIERVISRLGGIFDLLYDKVQLFRAERVGNENARRRILSPELKTTPNAARIHALRASKLKELKNLEGIVEDLFTTLTSIEIASEQLAVYEDTDREIRGQRADRDERQLPAMTYDFVDVLFTRYGVTGSMFGSLGEKQFKEIADIVTKHHASVLARLRRV